jgi:hypothetical protein
MPGFLWAKDNLTPAEVAQLTGLSVHTLSYVNGGRKRSRLARERCTDERM